MTDGGIVVQQLRRSLAIAKKDLRVYYSKGPVVIFGILMPAFLLLAFSIGREMSMESLMPAMLGMTVFFTASAVSPVIAPWETQARTLERLASCPVAVWTILLGDALASFVFGVAISIVPLVVGLGTGVNIVHPFVMVLSIILAAFCFSSLALLFSVPSTSSPATIMMLSSLVKFPLVFISGIFIPLGDLPLSGRAIAFISPLTYFTDLTRHSLQASGYLPVSIDLVVLLGFSALFLVLAIKLHQRTMPRRI